MMMFNGHGNRKIKLGLKKVRLSDLRKMTEKELEELGEHIMENLDKDKLDRLWSEYKMNVLKKESVDVDYKDIDENFII